MRPAEMRSPAPRANAEDRAEVSLRKSLPLSTASLEPEGNFAALYIARHYRLSPAVARAVAVLAGLGRAFG